MDSTAHRAYGPLHQAARRVLRTDLAEMWRQYRAHPDTVPSWWGAVSPNGPRCPRCGGLLELWQPLDCGHTNEADKARGLPGDRLEHAGCNRTAGASKVTVQPAGYTPSADW